MIPVEKAECPTDSSVLGWCSYVFNNDEIEEGAVCRATSDEETNIESEVTNFIYPNGNKIDDIEEVNNCGSEDDDDVFKWVCSSNIDTGTLLFWANLPEIGVCAEEEANFDPTKIVDFSRMKAIKV